ncbi:MAG: AAA family ATPase [Pseudomonadales bacterium]|nr:AAA family ATPase [Pseudomonadales bacterium]
MNRILTPLGYHNISELYNSGSTCVLKAIRSRDKTPVILRTFSVHPTPAQLARLFFSHEILNKFDHGNIVKTLEWVEADPWPIMELEDLDAIDLRHFSERFPNQQLPLDLFINIALQLAEALAVVHHAQVIHKDLHPGNIVINPDTQQVQLIDFGLSSLLSREQPALAPPENLEGVLAYISPEQTGRMNRALDYRTDFYSLGVTFYQLLTGTLPFHADDAMGLVHAHIAMTPPAVHELRSDIPECVSRIIERLMAKTAEKRYQSASGLAQDLTICRRYVIAGEPIPEITLGLNDVSDRLQIPQVLYGRDKEIEQLMSSFYQVAQGHPQLFTVTGNAGIGKSALIHEIHKPIAAHNGIFISGKFDQFQKNVPYSALKQAFSGWIQYALSLKDIALMSLREKLKQELGANARVLVDFLDEFRLLLGDLAPLKAVGPQENQNRFQLVMQRFIQLITDERPLVMFIDDVQWADRGTLSLLPVLMGTDLDGLESRLLLLMAYRDNEVDATHPAILTINKIQEQLTSLSQKSTVRTLNLKPLPVLQVKRLLGDALHQAPESVQPLAELTLKKTAGNPFFINEFLKTLYSKGLLHFNLARQQWDWDLDTINAEGITNNVVELMLEKMRQLPDETQRLLQRAACIGSLFDLQTLSIICEQPFNQVAKQLWPALKEGLLLQEGGDWLPGMSEGKTATQFTDTALNLSTRASPLVPHCRFLHDRMLQAAYQSLTEAEQQETHYSIGRLLLQHSDDKELEQQRFAVTEQLNKGRRLIADSHEKLALAELNTAAAQKAYSANVWDAAAKYASIGLELLPDQHWNTHHNLSFKLMSILTECEFLLGHTDKADQHYNLLLSQCRDPITQARLYAQRLSQLIAIARWGEAISLGLKGLTLLGVQIHNPEQGDNSALTELEQKFQTLTATDGLDAFLNLPDITEETELLIMQILPNLAQSCYILGNLDLFNTLILTGLNRILEFGKSEFTPVLLSCRLIMLRGQFRYRESYLAAHTINRVLAEYPACREISNSLNVIASHGLYLHAPYHQAIAMHHRGYELGLENGEISRAIINLSNSLFLQFGQGQPLKKVHTDALNCRRAAHRQGMVYPVPTIFSRLTAVLLNSENTSTHDLDDHFLSERLKKAIYSSFHITYLHHARAQLAFWNEDLKGALYHCHQLQTLIGITPGNCFSIDHLGLYPLLLCDALSSDSPALLGEQGVMSVETAEIHLDFCVQHLKSLSDYYAANFEHKYLLVLAEVERRRGKPLEVLLQHYKTAIQSAKTNGFTHFAALASERLADCLISKDAEWLAVNLLQDAMTLYEYWGCEIKLEKLKSRHQHLLARKMPISSTSTTTSTSESRVYQLDMTSVMKSAQAISSELTLSDLLNKVMRVILENAGAQAGALIMGQPRDARIQAYLRLDKSDSAQTLQTALNDADHLPKSIINYVLRTDKLVLLQAHTGNHSFMDDPYLQCRRPESLLCIPVDYRDQQVGALYLENTLTPDAFNQERLDVIKLLVSQAAISLENARLFAEVRNLNQGLEHKVAARTADLARANRELATANRELDAFTRTVSHDLRSPIRTIRGFCEALIEDCEVGLGTEGMDYAQRIMKGSERAADLINGLLELSRVQTHQLQRAPVFLSEMAEDIIRDLQHKHPEQSTNLSICPGIIVQGDRKMLYSALENLLSNAWKYSSKKPVSEITLGKKQDATHTIYYIRDNGAGFDMDKADALFATFQRLHTSDEFPGTGIGLATVQRIIQKHGGEIWAKSSPQQGATFFFTIPDQAPVY